MNYIEQADRIVRNEAELNAITGVSRTTRYEWEKQGLFPASIPLGPRARGYRMSSLQRWIAECAAATNGTKGGAK